jgi:Meiotically up-regulated gene 113
MDRSQVTRRRDGYVYAVVNSDAGTVKIGAAVYGRLRRRYWEADLWTGGQRVWVHSESEHEDCFKAERAVHLRLAHGRIDDGPRCETFWLSHPEVARWLAERRQIGVSIKERYRAMTFTEAWATEMSA